MHGLHSSLLAKHSTEFFGERRCFLAPDRIDGCKENSLAVAELCPPDKMAVALRQDGNRSQGFSRNNLSIEFQGLSGRLGIADPLRVLERARMCRQTNELLALPAANGSKSVA